MSARRPWRAAVIAGLVVFPRLAAGDALEITHVAPECVPSGRYARVTATATPADRVASAELQFRGEDEDAFYAARMARATDGAWRGSLPRPLRRLRRVEYRIVMTASDAQTSTTPVYAVDVRPDCEGVDAATEVAEPIVVRVPPGAPPVPPVPPAFSPAGVVAEAGPPPADKWRVAKWASGAVAAGGVAAVAAGAFSRERELPPAPDFALAGTAPGPGGVLSLSRDRLTVQVHVSGEPAAPLTFTWFFALPFGEPRPQACVTMSDTASIGAERPLVLQLSAELIVNGFCGFPTRAFDVDAGKLTIVVDGQVVHDETHELRMRVEP